MFTENTEVFRDCREDPEQSLRAAYEAVRQYSDGIRQAPEYQEALERFDAAHKPSVDLYLRRGVQSSIMAVELLAILTDSVRREQLLRQFDEEGIPDHWIEELALQHPVTSPHTISESGIGELQTDFGLKTLRGVKERDMNDVLQKIKADTDESQEASFRFHAGVIGYGHDLIINRYEQELVNFGCPVSLSPTFES